MEEGKNIIVESIKILSKSEADAKDRCYFKTVSQYKAIIHHAIRASK